MPAARRALVALLTTTLVAMPATTSSPAAAESSIPCDPTLTSLVPFTTAPCMAVPPVQLPVLDQNDCVLTQLAALVAADEEAGLRYRTRLLGELLRQQAEKAAGTVGTSEPPSLPDLLDNALVTPADLTEAMLQAADAPDDEVTARIAHCGADLGAPSQDTLAASQLPPHSANVGVEPVRAIDHINAILAYLQRATTSLFKSATTVAVGAAFQAGGKVRWRAYVDVKKNHLTAEQKAAVELEVDKVIALFDDELGIPARQTTRPPGEPAYHAEQELLYDERDEVLDPADLVLVGASNHICADRCWPLLRTRGKPLFLPVTGIAKAMRIGDTVYALGIQDFRNIMAGLRKTDAAGQRTIVDELTAIFTSSADPDTLLHKLSVYDVSLKP